MSDATRRGPGGYTGPGHTHAAGRGCEGWRQRNDVKEARKSEPMTPRMFACRVQAMLTLLGKRLAGGAVIRCKVHLGGGRHEHGEAVRGEAALKNLTFTSQRLK